MVGIEDERHRTIIDQSDLHHRAKFTGGHGVFSQEHAEIGTELFVKGFGDFRRCGVIEGRAGAFFGAGVQGELTDDQCLSANLGERSIHRARIIGEDPEFADFLGQPFSVGRGVIAGDAEQDHNALADFADHLFGNRNAGLAYALNNYPHR